MSRIYTRNSRGRQPMLGATTLKFSKSREHPSDSYRPKRDKAKPLPKKPIARKPVGKRKREDTPASEESSSSFGGFDSADDASDEGSEEGDADDDLPAARAPSRSRTMNGTGRKPRFKHDNVSDAGSDSMFGDFDDYFEDDEDPNVSPEENRKRFEDKVFADSDDDDDSDIYQAVDEISDSDEDMDEERIQQQELLAMLPEEALSDTDFLNQIDGLSAYGFGDESDASVYPFRSSHSGESGTEAGAERHVHFAADADPTIFMRLPDSPTMTRALLPSALPDTGFSTHGAESRVGGLADDVDDSDLTDDCLPDEALLTAPHQIEEEREVSPLPSPPSTSKKSGKKAIRRKGPPRGIFIDDGDKTSGILDSSGKYILMTNPHLLGEEFARRYGASQASSPDVGFAELIEESDGGDYESTELMVGPAPDIMIAGLNSPSNGPLGHGQTVGPREAFYPSTNFLFDDGVHGDIPGDDLGEDVINLEDVIKFDDSDPDDSDALTSPIFVPGQTQTFSGKDFSHLNSGNVTAFRQNADPALLRMRRLSARVDMGLVNSPLATTSPRRRKRTHSSPYTSSHYHGVTPVQRMRDPNDGRNPETATPAKKRRFMI